MVDRADRVSFSVEAMVRGYHTYLPIAACCSGVCFAYAPLDFERGVTALFTASLASFIAAGLMEVDKDPVGAGRTESAVLK